MSSTYCPDEEILPIFGNLAAIFLKIINDYKTPRPF